MPHCVAVDKVVAMYTYQAQRDDELSFAVDDVITVVDRSSADWWHGQLGGQAGLFPSNYVSAPRDNNDLAPPTVDLPRMYPAALFPFHCLRPSYHFTVKDTTEVTVHIIVIHCWALQHLNSVTAASDRLWVTSSIIGVH